MSDSELAKIEAVGISLTPGETAANSVAAQAQAQVQARFVVAQARPRNIDLARLRLLEACRRPGFADAAVYERPVGGGKSASGPSIRFAEEAVRQMGNLLVQSSVIFDDERKRVLRIMATDLETNSTVEQDILVEKTVERSDPKGRKVLAERVNSYGKTSYLVEASDDEMVVKQAAHLSKGFRTVALRLVPSDIVEEALAMCRKTSSDATAKDPAEGRRKLVDAFAGVGVRPDELEKYLGKKLESLSPRELDGLRARYIAVKEGESLWGDGMASGGGTVAPPAPVASSAQTVEAEVKPTTFSLGIVAPEHTDQYAEALMELYRIAANPAEVKEVSGLHQRAPQSWQAPLGKAFQAAMKRVKS